MTKDLVKAVLGPGVATNYGELAEALGVKESTIRSRWATAGMPHKGKGRYPIAEIAFWRLKEDEANEERRDTKTEAAREHARRREEAEARKAEIQADRLEFEHERALGRWIRLADVQRAIATILAVLSQRLSDMPHKLAPHLPEETAKTVVPFLQREVGRNLTWCDEELRRKVVPEGEE